ncbi:hypothetical protein APHAL10511_000280 [Amanita phalloides]|nr:hypothetical protein APHAL10511_000280 [Amanita phalloides]
MMQLKQLQLAIATEIELRIKLTIQGPKRPSNNATEATTSSSITPDAVTISNEAISNAKQGGAEKGKGEQGGARKAKGSQKGKGRWKAGNDGEERERGCRKGKGKAGNDVEERKGAGESEGQQESRE